MRLTYFAIRKVDMITAGILLTPSKDLLPGISDRLSTLTMNLFGTFGRFDSRFTLESGKTAKAEPVLKTSGREVQNKADFMTNVIVQLGRKKDQGE